MRLFDKCLAGANEESEWRTRLLGSTVVACDVIAQYYADTAATEDAEEIEWSEDMAPYCRLPWQAGFFEWNVPQLLVSQEKAEGRRNDLQQWGWSVYEMVGAERREAERIFRSIAAVASPQSVILRATPVFVTGGACQIYLLSSMIEVAPDGAVVRIAYAGPAIDNAKKQGYLQEFIESYKTQENVLRLALTFINCSNVKLEDVTNDLQPPAKIMRRLKLPEVKRYTLNICGHVVKPSRDYNSGPQGVMPFHLCRGHFATYTAEKPMFGNPKLVGRFWHPPHMKGKKENGEVIKDYAIAAEAGT